MRSTAFAAIVLLCSTLLVGCHSTKVIMQGDKRTPVSVDEVKVYSTMPDDAQAVAILMATAGGKTQGSVDKAILRLREKAASLGANGILVNSAGSTTTFINYWPSNETQVSANAFYR